MAYANVTGGNGGINGHYTFANGQLTRDDGNMASVKKTSGWDSCQAEGGIAEICGQASRDWQPARKGYKQANKYGLMNTGSITDVQWVNGGHSSTEIVHPENCV